jgi:threonine dehydratase
MVEGLDRRKPRKVRACSSGNHGAALAHAAKMHGLPATVIIPRNAPRCKIAAAQAAGANIVLCEPTMQARQEAAEAHIAAHPSDTFIPPYNHPHIIAGQGTIALELLEQVEASEFVAVGSPPVTSGDRDAALKALDAVVVPVSGGGLIGGIATVIKARAPGCKVRIISSTRAADALLMCWVE